MNRNEALGRLAETEREGLALRHAMGILMLDGETAAPKHSAKGRGETMAFLAGLQHALLTDGALGEALELLKQETLDKRDERRVQILSEQREDLTLVPADEYAAYERLLTEAGSVWHEAKLKSDFQSFAPYLTQITAYNRRFAERKNASKPAYDVLLDTYERGANMADLDVFFERLSQGLSPLIREIAAMPKRDAPFLHQRYPAEEQRRFAHRLMALEGISEEDCTLAESEHPFTDAYNRHDVRITTHYYEEDVLSSLYSVLHEGGHALYELGSGEDLEGTVLSGGATMGIHESQSRFYENIIGRSRPFCAALLPVMQECFPKQTEGLDSETLYRMVNRSKPSLIRTEADELTYSLHVAVRYETEKGLVMGSLKVTEVPGEWNRLMREKLGVTVPDDRRGALQDSHWSGGSIGYFPSYALGSAYGAQMLSVMQRTVNVWDAVGTGDLSGVTGWLRERIHRHGNLLTPQELLKNALEGPFDVQYYIDYLTDKFTELYGIR